MEISHNTWDILVFRKKKSSSTPSSSGFSHGIKIIYNGPQPKVYYPSPVHLLITMMNKLFLTLLSSFLLCVLAAPPTPKTLVQVRDSRATLPFVTRFNASGSKIPEVDRARAAGLREHALGIKSDSSKSTHGKRQSSFTVTNQVVSYVASVGVGSPPSSFNLIIDTGSSNTWVGADKQFQSTQTTEPTLEPMAVEYGSGFFVGQACDFSSLLTTFSKKLLT